LLWRVLDSLRAERSRRTTAVDVQPFVRGQLETLALIAQARGIRWHLRMEEAHRIEGARLGLDDFAHAFVSLGINVLAEAPDGSELAVIVDRVPPAAVALTPVHD